jgi:hypothetical protein
MISGTRDRRRRVLAWSVFISIVLNVAILSTILHYAPILWGTKRGAVETVRATQFLSLEKKPVATPAPPTVQQPVPKAAVVPKVVVQLPPAAAPPHHELSRDDQNAPPQPPAPTRPTTLQSRIDADSRGFSNTVARLNAQNGAHAIPTIDPATQGGPSKTYGFRAPAGMGGASAGNGIITPSESWHDRGEDCYYARYEYTYPDGAQESGNIVWPVCFNPGADPFKEGRHEMPFPQPIAGFRLPAGTDLPPIEKRIYAEWISEQ